MQAIFFTASLQLTGTNLGIFCFVLFFFISSKHNLHISHCHNYKYLHLITNLIFLVQCANLNRLINEKFSEMLSYPNAIR